MSERLADVLARIGSMRQLDSVMLAMRGIAAAREREARERLAAIRAYAAAIARAIGLALAMASERDDEEAPPARVGLATLVVFVAEQGFAGAFSDHVLDVARDLMAKRPSRLLLAGDRGLVRARERAIEVEWSAPMMTHVGEATAFADRIADEIYRRLATGQTSRVTVVHAAPDGPGGFSVQTKVLAPFDYGRFPIARGANPPLTHLPPRELLARLAEEYVFAELCESGVLSFAAESEARMRAMTSARANVVQTLDDLVSRSRRLRQEEITAEIIELFEGGDRG